MKLERIFLANIKQALKLDALASGDSVIHRLDGRIKLISLLAIIVYCVFSSELIIPIILEVYLLIVMRLSKLSYVDSFKRVLVLLPFGGMIIIFQPFIHPGNVLWSYSWLTVSDAGVNFAIILLARLIVSLTAIVILSSTSPMQQIIASLRKLRMPKDLAMILSIMVRFLFMFIEELESIRKAQSSRNFHIHNKKTSYVWRLKQVGFTVAMMFLKSYEQGENVYRSMVSRGFSENSEFYSEKEKLDKNDYYFIFSLIIVLSVLTIVIFSYSGAIGYLGQNLALN